MNPFAKHMFKLVAVLLVLAISMLVIAWLLGVGRQPESTAFWQPPTVEYMFRSVRDWSENTMMAIGFGGSLIIIGMIKIVKKIKGGWHS